MTGNAMEITSITVTGQRTKQCGFVAIGSPGKICLIRLDAYNKCIINELS